MLDMGVRGIEGRIFAVFHFVAVEEVLVEDRLKVSLDHKNLLRESF